MELLGGRAQDEAPIGLISRLLPDEPIELHARVREQSRKFY
jgi:hypothetical protein